MVILGDHTLSQLLPTIGRRAGNIPASDPDTHPDLPRSRDQCRHKRKRQDPAVGPWRESAPTPIQLSRARRGVWKAPAHAHSDDSVAHPLSRFCRGQRCTTTEERGRRVTGFRELFTLQSSSHWPHLCATPCRRSCARAAGGAVISAGAPLISVASRLRSRYRKFT